MSSSSSSAEATPAVAPAPAAAPKAGPRQRKPCTKCGKWFNKKSKADHGKVHKLEEMGVPALRPCSKCTVGSQCLVARHPEEVTTYACICCLRAHRQCSFTTEGRHEQMRTGQQWVPVHPAL
ncbi:hypothetical protein FSARC_205 [Fusarium sarcochroum]|uniref:C2H2-type domain-containing protein n=1 Tax=Fusarium sarcochroum TaxID=1208366 RepID=A0A8H4UCK1_9HYPO|nr:hypothetical protein FSARC_205 [Fusarium sarcochroum]